ncbi:MAG: hypothetical protein RLZ35_1097 [Pseudomonadota bacterium]|jgi:hypothetical protein
MSTFSKSIEKHLLDVYGQKQDNANVAELPKSILDAIKEMIAPFESGDYALFVEPETCPDWLIDMFETQIGLFFRIEEKKRDLKLVNDIISANSDLLNMFKQLFFDDLSKIADPQVNANQKETLTKELQALENEWLYQTQLLSGIPEVYQLIQVKKIPKELEKQYIEQYKLFFKESIGDFYEKFYEYSIAELKDYTAHIKQQTLDETKKRIEEALEDKPRSKRIHDSANKESSAIIKNLVEFYQKDIKNFHEVNLFYDLTEDMRILQRNRFIQEKIKDEKLENIPSLNLLLSEQTFFPSTEECILSIHILMELENINIENKKRFGTEISFKRMDKKEQLKSIKKLTTLTMETKELENKLANNLEDCEEQLNFKKIELTKLLDDLSSSTSTNSFKLSLAQQGYASMKEISKSIYHGINNPLNNAIANRFVNIANQTDRQLPENIRTALKIAQPASSLIDRINYMLGKKDTDTALQLVFKWFFATLVIGISACLVAAIIYFITQAMLIIFVAKSALAVFGGIFFIAAMASGTFLGTSKLIHFIQDNKIKIRNQFERLIYGAKNHERFLIADEVKSKYNETELYALQKFFLTEINDSELRLEAMRPNDPRLTKLKAVHDNLVLCWEKIRNGSVTQATDLNYYLSKIYATWSSEYNSTPHTADERNYKLKSFMTNIETNVQLFKKISSDEPTLQSFISSIKPYLGLRESQPEKTVVLAPMSDPDQIESCKHLRSLQNSEQFIANLLRRPAV